jgi:hypothetical protein
VNPWLVFALTCLGMAGVSVLIGLLWTEGFARLCTLAMRRAVRRRHAEDASR